MVVNRLWQKHVVVVVMSCKQPVDISNCFLWNEDAGSEQAVDIR